MTAEKSFPSKMQLSELTLTLNYPRSEDGRTSITKIGSSEMDSELRTVETTLAVM